MQFLTVRQVAELLQVSEKTVYAWVEQGRLTASVVRLPSGRIRFAKDLLLEELRAWTQLHQR